jgi:hypothetical protein
MPILIININKLIDPNVNKDPIHIIKYSLDKKSKKPKLTFKINYEKEK